MPTIIDSLLVKLGLDTKDYDKAKQKVDKGLKDTADKGKQEFKSLTESATKFFAVIGGAYAIKSFIENQIEANSALNKFSKNLGESANTVSAWSNAAELAGGSAQGLQGTFDMLSKAQTDLQITGESGLLPFFAMLGVSMTDAYGKARPVTELLLDIGQKLMQKSPDRKTAFNLGQRMGIDAGTLNLILRRRAEAELLINQKKEQAAVTDRQAEAFDKLDRAIKATTQGIVAFGRDVLAFIIENSETATVFLGSLAAVLAIKFLPALISAAAAGWAFIAPFLIAASPLLLVASAITAVVMALKNDYDVWKSNGESLINWTGIVKMATAAVKGLSDAWSGVKNFFGFGGGESGGVAPSSMDDRQRFISSAAKQLGVPEAAIDAQLRLETGAVGKSTIGKFNYGNVKAGSGWSGSTEEKSVLEYDSRGNAMREVSKFRSYQNPEDAASDYVRMIKNNFPGAVGAQSAEGFASGLKAGGYATDPNYVSKISRIASGIRGASQAAIGAGATQQSSLMAASGARSGNSSVETNVGQVNVYTQATDAEGIVRDIRKSMDFLAPAPANYGSM